MIKMIKILIGLVIGFVIFLLIIFATNEYVKLSTKSKIVSAEDCKNLENIDCILILGAGVWGENPSPMLEDRLLQGIELYNKNVSSKIIVSGDHGQDNYDEVNIMKKYLIERGVPSEDIFMDHAGFCSYDSMYRAKDIFEAKNIVIVTQKYHLYRSLYIANALGLNAFGVGSDSRKYQGESFREAREIAARDKDFVKCIFKPNPKYLGDQIPVSGNGNVTNDKEI